MKFEAAQIHFLSDVFVAVAVDVAFSLKVDFHWRVFGYAR